MHCAWHDRILDSLKRGAAKHLDSVYSDILAALVVELTRMIEWVS